MHGVVEVPVSLVFALALIVVPMLLVGQRIVARLSMSLSLALSHCTRLRFAPYPPLPLPCLRSSKGRHPPIGPRAQRWQN